MKFHWLKQFSTSLGLLLMIAPSARAVEVGSKAPVFQAKNQDGKLIDFGKVYKDSKLVFIYFYPKADTPGCTDQANSLKNSYEVLHGKSGVAVFGVSSDEQDILKDFRKKYSLPFDLIADTDKSVIKAFDVPSLAGFAKRQAFLIQEGRIVWLDRSASTKNQAEDILNFLNSTNERKIK